MADTLTFGGVTLSNYGVYISTKHTLSGAERMGESIQIRGRNGRLRIDDGCYDNITVEYPCYVRSGLESSLPGLRDLLSTKGGYQRLSDTIHPDEYRMGCLVGGMEVEPSIKRKSGRFTLSFDCKPQRYLTKDEGGYWMAGSYNASTIDTSTGAVVQGPGTCTGMFPISGCTLTALRRDVSSHTYPIVIAYYDTNRAFLEAVSHDWTKASGAASSTFTWTFGSSDPSGAVYARVDFPVCLYSASLRSGDHTVGLSQDGMMTCQNPTQQTAKPFLRLWNNNAGEDMRLLLNDYVVTVQKEYFSDTGHDCIGIDCETMNCYYNSVNCNRWVRITKGGLTATEYPTMPPGTSSFYCTNLDRIEVYPRWWRI